MIPVGGWTLAGALSTVGGWLVRLGWKTVQTDRQKLADIREELILQRTNCLNTLQEQGRDQVELLGKINDNLTEQNGFLKGFIEGSRR